MTAGDVLTAKTLLDRRATVDRLLRDIARATEVRLYVGDSTTCATIDDDLHLGLRSGISTALACIEERLRDLGVEL